MTSRKAIVARSGAVLLERLEVACTPWQRFRGLMLRKRLDAGQGLLLPGCRSIHTCFMRFPIDVIYLDRAGCVVRIVEGMKPWRLSACWAADAVLEVPAGRARAAGLCPGDQLQLPGPDGAPGQA